MMPIDVLAPDGAGWSANILLSSILCGYLWFCTHCQWSGDFIQSGSIDFTVLKVSTFCMVWYILITTKRFGAKEGARWLWIQYVIPSHIKHKMFPANKVDSCWCPASMCCLFINSHNVCVWLPGSLIFINSLWPIVAWQHQAFTWTNVDLSSVMSSDIHHLRTISHAIPQPLVT